MPSVENEVLDFAMMIVKEAAEAHRKRFTERQIRRIALETLKKDKLHDSEWVEGFVLETAKVLREKRREAAGLTTHAEFTGFKTREYSRFVELYGDESIAFMKQHLQDLTQIAPAWAAQFTAAVQSLGGFRAVEEQASTAEVSVWEFVTKRNPEKWSESRAARRPWIGRRRPRNPTVTPVDENTLNSDHSQTKH